MDAYHNNFAQVIFESVTEAPHVVGVDLNGCSSFENRH